MSIVTSKATDELLKVSPCGVNDSDVILLNDYKITCIIGILPQERITPQTLLLSFEFYCAPNLPLTDFDLSQSISYADAAEFLANLAQETKAGTLEYLARLMIDGLFKRYGPTLRQIVLTLRKPDILTKAHYCGIRVTRANPKVQNA